MKHSALLTDLYQLTMMAGYYENNLNETATFELFVRNYPPNRNYLIFAGLEQILDYTLNIKFTEQELEYLRKHPTFKNIRDEFFDYLKDFKFTGDIWAMPEGTVFFPNEPVMRITAPIIQAQLLETYILSMFNFQTMIATKASRIVSASQGRQIIEFGSRRAHGPDAAVLAARASYIGGCTGTSNVYAGHKFGLPIYGTIAHSWIMAFDSEEEAFEKYYKSYPDNTILLVDTYNTIEGIKKATKISSEIKGIRLDSGDFYLLSLEARKILDDAGLQNTKIVASGDLNEYKIKDLIEKGAPIDAFGVGTELVVSADAPALGGLYKLVEIEKDSKSIYKAKFSQNKITYPGKKQVWRFLDNNKLVKDVIADTEENIYTQQNAIPLLSQIVKEGKVLSPLPNINEIKRHCLNNLMQLDKNLSDTDSTSNIQIEISKSLQAKYNQLKNSVI
ncbi:MAG: nicotinate phosphoribosyltransferase [Candidatus Melainabacteria bacterium RIFOXYA12_FULL_32_12]|nr:MAG: nicotinate phosphoribosyltransferase [Candidatus Melainabacteria bacterium RIFOXYA12_FULL_32_12]